MRTRDVVLVVLVALMTGCSGTGADKTSSRSSPSPAPPVAVTADVAYSSETQQGWDPPLLDVYRPKGARGLPLVVMLHGAGNTKASLADIAYETALLGAVVVVPNWGGATTEPPASAAVAQLRRTKAVAGCAVWYAIAHAGDWGADASRLVLFGHSGGANTALVTLYEPPTAVPGCNAPATTWQPRGVLLWEGDWLIEAPDWDVFGTSLPAVMRAVTPWHLLARAPKVPVELAVTDNSRQNLTRCETSAPGWLRLRDPDGAFRSRLTALGALRDGCVDVGDAADLLAATLRDHQVAATSLRLVEPDSRHDRLAPGDLAILVRHVVALASR